ncbi:hypothetical protein [Granulicella pectinivorans]|nr:hypothetical protein [Granulicella pectinivorans]
MKLQAIKRNSGADMIRFQTNDFDQTLGFRAGDKGTHSSRTMMFTELDALIRVVPEGAAKQDYADAVVSHNCLRKATTATRRLTLQRLTELYGLDPKLPIFRVLRRLWDAEPSSGPLLSLLTALARDPLLLATAQVILPLNEGVEMPRKLMTESLRSAVGTRLSDATLDKVVRNAASSWSQAGHLRGRTFKVREKVTPTPRLVAFALYLGTGAGLRGDDLLTSGWIKTLDCPPSQALDLAIEAKKLGLLDLRVAGDVFDLSLSRLDPQIPGGRA